jgi:hypothetical protein
MHVIRERATPSFLAVEVETSSLPASFGLLLCLCRVLPPLISSSSCYFITSPTLPAVRLAIPPHRHPSSVYRRPTFEPFYPRRCCPSPTTPKHNIDPWALSSPSAIIRCPAQWRCHTPLPAWPSGSATDRAPPLPFSSPLLRTPPRGMLRTRTGEGGNVREEEATMGWATMPDRAKGFWIDYLKID